MNTNPSAKRILVFGDSNTWGHPPGGEKFRYSPKERYPGILQDLLGSEYEVIEEGLCGRTICATSPREETKGRLGINYILPCISSHSPLDLIIVNLGTNEYKKRFGLSAEDISHNLQKLCKVIKTKECEEDVPEPKVLILSPGYVDETKADDEFKEFEGLSRAIAPLFEKVAKEEGFYFANLGDVAIPGEDGLHYSLSSHRDVAIFLEKKMKEIGL